VRAAGLLAALLLAAPAAAQDGPVLRTPRPEAYVLLHDPPPAAPSLAPGRRDAWVALGSAALVVAVSTRDRAWLARATSDHSRFALDLAADARRAGDPVWVGGALLATDAAARVAGARPVAAACERIAFSCASAGVVTFALKEGVGRERPDETADPHRFRPLRGHDAFPSGHATTAFALASALTRECRAPAVPAIAFPVAALTAWSRVRDRRHWPSDVVAGAAIGAGVAWRMDAWLAARLPDGVRLAVLPGRGASLALAARF
jgi:membrane-associated phospholipid phosphatase